MISIITPTFNRAKLLKETIISVLNQSYKNFEYIIIDDGSTDNTREVVNSFDDKRIRYFYQENVGIPAAVRNKGIKKAKGDYVAFIDHDDLWHREKLKKQINFMKKNKEIIVCATNGLVFPSFPPRKYLYLKENKIVSIKDLIKKNYIINSSVLIRSDIFEKIGLFNTNLGTYFPDYEFWVRILKHRDNSIEVLKDILIYYRIYQKSISQVLQLRSDSKLAEYKKLKSIFKKVKNHTDVKRSVLKNKLIYYKGSILARDLLKKNLKLTNFILKKEFNLKVKLYVLMVLFQLKSFSVENKFLGLLNNFLKNIGLIFLRLLNIK